MFEDALAEREQPTWQEALAVLDADFEGWELPPIRVVLRDIEEGFE